MRASYDRETDILMIELSKKHVDDTREVDNIVIHVAKDGEPVLLEIMEASEFLSETRRLVDKGSAERFQKLRTSA